MATSMIVDCETCGVRVDGKLVAEYRHFEQENVGDRFFFVECPACHSPILLQSNFQAGSLTEMWAEPTRLYPATGETVSPSVPHNLRQSFGEAAACLRCGAYTACVIMCRKTIEALCVAKGANSGTLASKLKKLRDDRVVDDRLFRWADMLRVAGNEAAHDVEMTTTKGDARDILDFSRALLEYIFTFEQRFEDFVSRREQKAK